MSGGVFGARGSTGPAPTTVFMAPVPDRYNMLLQMYVRESPTRINNVKMIAANTIDKWTPWNLSLAGGANTNTISLGSAAEAPDGTNTAFKIVEGSNNGVHFFVAGYPEGSSQRQQKRFAAFCKAAERTRVYMSIGFAQGCSFESGARVVFDLAVGQVGVAAAPYGPDPGWIVKNTEITPYGNGWYLCKIDVAVTLQSNGILSCAIGPDSGSGTGALSNSYLGNGSSGIYIWRTNVLPPRAWGMNNVSYFDDFTDTSGIDMANSKAPGFGWYTSVNWIDPSYVNVPPIQYPVSGPYISQSGSTITLNNSGNLTSLWSAVRNGTSYTGNAYQPPLLWEYNIKWNNDAPLANPPAAVWTQMTEMLLAPTDPTAVHVYSEIDFMEAGGGTNGAVAIAAIFDNDFTALRSGGQMWMGYPPWINGKGFGPGQVVHYNGVLYQSLVVTQADQPDISPTKWGLYTPLVNEPTLANSILHDWNQFHTYACLWLNDNSVFDITDTGEIMFFCNGIFIGNATTGEQTTSGANRITYGTDGGPLGRTNTTFKASADYAHHVFIIMSAPVDRALHIDWCRFTQQ